MRCSLFPFLCSRTVLRKTPAPVLAAALLALLLAGPGLLRAETPQAAAPAVEAVKVVKDLPYLNIPDPDAYQTSWCKLDLVLPAAGKNFPTLVWFYGGGLTAGNKDDEGTQAIARHFAQHGVGVAVVNYRLSPKATYPAYVEDAAAGFAWTKKHIAEYGGDAGKVFIGGHSAGGYLALMVSLDPALLQRHGLGLESIAGAFPVAGQTLTHYTIRAERGLSKDRLLADSAAPVNHVSKAAPPMLILYAERDMAMRGEENELLAAALRNVGHERITIQMIPGSDHGSVGNDLSKAGNAGFAAALKFILPDKP